MILAERRGEIRFSRAKIEEAEVGFEPTNNGFAIRPLSPLGYSAAGHAPSTIAEIDPRRVANTLANGGKYSGFG